ncbi:MAG: response regulator [Acidobacteria bacterium]|nr:response regulator [Acidobacteriota bacterium]
MIQAIPPFIDSEKAAGELFDGRALAAAEACVMEERLAGNPVVLLVEDFDDTRKLMRHVLELCGCRVLEAANGQEAIELAQRTERLDLILMDLNMPVLDGFTATLRIREYEQTRNVPVVAVTAFDTAEFRAAASAVGCNDYVVKPLDFERLATLLKQFLSRAAAVPPLAQSESTA